MLDDNQIDAICRTALTRRSTQREWSEGGQSRMQDLACREIQQTKHCDSGFIVTLSIGGCL